MKFLSNLYLYVYSYLLRYYSSPEKLRFRTFATMSILFSLNIVSVWLLISLYIEYDEMFKLFPIAGVIFAFLVFLALKSHFSLSRHEQLMTQSKSEKSSTVGSMIYFVVSIVVYLSVLYVVF